MELLNQKWVIVDIIDAIAIPDCFVKRNKLDFSTGHGEAKLYIGAQNTIENKAFFSKQKMQGLFRKKDLLSYLEDAKFEYENSEQVYRKDIAQYWLENRNKIEDKEENHFLFNFNESSAGGTRFYIESCNKQDIFYQEFRIIMLPEITYLSIVKLENNGQFLYYFKPYLNFFYDSKHHASLILTEEQNIDNDNTLKLEEKSQVKQARIGQGKYRNSIIEEMRECLITGVNDERVLIASHIKPWAICHSIEEKTDKYNGLLLTPTYDRLFDQGFITFLTDGTLQVSPYISQVNIKRLGLINNKTYPLKQHKKREFYLEYHRKEIFKKG